MQVVEFGNGISSDNSSLVSFMTGFTYQWVGCEMLHEIVNRPHAASTVRRIQKGSQIALPFGLRNLQQQLLGVLQSQRLELDLLKETEERQAAIGDGFE